MAGQAMTAEDIRAIECGSDPAQNVQFLREIAAQLAERNAIKREELGLRQTAQVNERLTTKNRKLIQALLSTNKRIREDLQNHSAAGHEPLAVKRMREQLERNEELLDDAGNH
jgi:hypothetical protein